MTCLYIVGLTEGTASHNAETRNGPFPIRHRRCVPYPGAMIAVGPLSCYGVESEMSPSESYLNRSYAVLIDDGLPAPQRLAHAGKLFWKAIILDATWGAPHEQRAGAILHELVDCGVIGHERPIDAEAAQSLCDKMLRFIEDSRMTRRADQDRGITGGIARVG